MFTDLYQQNTADMMKGIIEAVKPHGDQHIAAQKRRAMQCLQAFERCGWNPYALEEAIEKSGPGRLVLKEQNCLAFEHRTDQPGEAVVTLLEVLGTYLALMQCSDESPVDLPSDPSEKLTTEQAAAYLNLSIATIKRHVYNTFLLKGELKGKTMLFSREELDRFKQSERPKVGRPSKSE